MTQRSVGTVIILTIVTFGIYGLVWLVKTKDELNARGAAIPTGWLLIVPIANLFWMWKYGEGAEKVTNKEVSGAVVFLLMLVFFPAAQIVAQGAYNKLAAGPARAAA